MTTSSRSPTKLSHAIHMDPSGDEAIAGQSSCRNWWPTGVELICAQRGKRERKTADARNRMGTLYHRNSCVRSLDCHYRLRCGCGCTAHVQKLSRFGGERMHE